MRVGLLLVLSHTFALASLFASDPPRNTGSPYANQKTAALDSLRQALGLSAHVQIEWNTSRNGTDTISVTDNFNRDTIGPDWAVDSQYWAIKDGELVLTPEANSEWRYLAVFTKIGQDVERKIFSVSYRWGKKADALGIGEGAFALMMSKPDIDANGYWCWRRTNQKSVWLYAIKNGIWEYTPGKSKEYNRAPARTPVPRAGDVVEVVPHLEEDGMYFDYYVNGQYDATVADLSKEYSHHFPWYAGVFIHGQSLNNPVDDFRISWTPQDEVAPARINDLNARTTALTAITLEWTATGDNNYDGVADRYEIRYSRSPITAQNFGSALLVQEPPAPGDPGQQQHVTVDGLQTSTTYYFAIRVFDEVGNGSSLSNVLEARTKEAGVPTQLQLVDGCGQTGEVGKPLAQKIVARVLDQYNAPVPERNVRFVVLSGGGQVQGATNLVVPTDGNGRASVTWTLGAAPGQNKIEVRSFSANSTPLTGSPISCTANGVTGAPAKLQVASNHRKLYPVNSVTDTLVVRVTDASNNPVSGKAVKFSVLAGAGYLMNGQLPERKIYQTISAANGAAKAVLNTGAVFGDTTKISVVLEAVAPPLVLQPALFVVAAPPDSMKAVSGNEQSALLNATLPEPLKVQIFDATGLPAANHAVTFSILTGGGKFGNGGAQFETITDSQGFAKTALKLGALPGNNQVQVKSQFKGKALRHSPVSFIATAVTGTISPSLSAVMVAPQNGLLADSVSAAVVTVSLYDEFNNPVPGKNVRIKVTGERIFIKQPSAPTDLNGEATAEVRSKKAGFKMISAYVLPENLVLFDSVRVRFNEIAAARMRLFSGNNQTAKANTILPQPVCLELLDKFGNPPKPTNVTFTVLTGGGTIIGYRNVNTDSKGQARAVWQLGANVGEQKLEAHGNSLQGSPINFTATATPVGNSVDEKQDGAVPKEIALLQNSPNPFNPETQIHFDLPAAAEVEITLYDLTGRFVARLFSGHKSAGRHHVRWNGRDHHNQPLESGVYVYRMRAQHGRAGQEFVATKKLTLLK